MIEVAEATDTLNILIVEDDLHWRYEHRDMFENWGFNIIKNEGSPGVKNRMDALRMLIEPEPNEKIDVVVLDLIMTPLQFDDLTPEQKKAEDGFEITEGEKLLDMLNFGMYETVGRPIFIIYTTSKSHDHIMDKYPDMVYGIINKSIVDQEEIKDIVRTSIRKRGGYGYFNFE